MCFSCLVLKSMQPFSICRNRDPNISLIFIGYLVSNKKESVHLRIGNTFPFFLFSILVSSNQMDYGVELSTHTDRNILRFLTFHIVIRLKRNFSNGLISCSIHCVNVDISCGMVKWLCFNFELETHKNRFHQSMIGIRKLKSLWLFWASDLFHRHFDRVDLNSLKCRDSWVKWFLILGSDKLFSFWMGYWFH